jgi:hypothetical protein
MIIHKMRMEHRFYIPFVNFLMKHLSDTIRVEEAEQGIKLHLPRKFLTVVGWTPDQEQTLLHLFGKHYVMFQYYYNYDY